GDPDDIVGQVGDVVGFDFCRTVTAAIAALVRHGHLKPGVHQEVDLMAPEIPTLREAVKENNKRSFAFDHGTQPDAIRLDLSERALLHVFPPMDGYDVVTLGEGHLTPLRTASGHNETFQLQQYPNVAAMRWRASLAGIPSCPPT